MWQGNRINSQIKRAGRDYGSANYERAFFLGQKSEEATEQDRQVIADLRDTLAAHRESCVGMAANMIGSRALSKKELTRRLIQKGNDASDAQAAADWLEDIGAVDDAGYAAALVRHYSRLGYGPARVREKLYEKGVPRELWEGALEELPADGGQVDAFLRSKLRGRPPDEKEKRRLTNALLRRGFPWGEVKAAWRRLGEEMQED